MRPNRAGLAATALLLAASLAGCGLIDASGASPTTTPEPTTSAPSPAQPATSESPTASPSPDAPSSAPEPRTPVAATRAPATSLAVAPGTDTLTLALTSTRLFWSAAPVVVVGWAGDREAAQAAEDLAVPFLPTSLERAVTDDEGAPIAPAPLDEPAREALEAELTRLGTIAVVSLDPGFEAPAGVEVLSPGDALPEVRPATPVDGAVLLVDGRWPSRAAASTARAAGAEVLAVRSGDPRASDELVALHTGGRAPASVTALGDVFGDAEQLSTRMASVRTGVSLPGGGQLVFDGKRYVALYGSPLTPALGVLGEQSVTKSVTRARKLAKKYEKLVEEEVVPMFEIIVTVASAGAGKDGNYSNELDPETIRPYVEAAREKGVYVLLDLQPGRTDFLTQAKLYEEFLLEPHVGLALDPEWRLKKNQVHLRQIGSVGIKEVNRVGDYLAELVREHALPQKMFVLHQFTTSMIRNRDKLRTTHPELATVVHVDGQGALGSKYGTWANIRKDAPDGLYWGWKNFYDEDIPMATPKQTVAVDPTPDLVTYQ